MPRLRNPSLKIRENLENGPSTRSAKARTPSETMTSPPTRATPSSHKAPKAAPARRGRGRPKPATGSRAKPTGRPRKAKAKREQEFNDYGYEYDSHSSSSSSSSDEEFFPDLKHEPNDDIDDEETEDAQQNLTKDPVYDEDGELLCPWIEPDHVVPLLILPESSEDIPTHKEYILDLVEIYEILRSFSRVLKLTPFLFEDFCAAMSSQDNSCILSEIHVSLLKACLRADDEDQVHYSANDTNNAVNISFYALDSMTYAEVLRLYLESDKTKGRVPDEIIHAINTPNYPFVGIEVRASVITYLCYRFLDLNDFKRIVANSGKAPSEENCRTCLRSGGSLLNCNNCELSFHSYCYALKEKPDPFICDLCKQNDIRGVTGCEPLDQTTTRQPLRMVPMGRDRHGRIYWFVVRRIIVQDEAESALWYYSTAPQLQELVTALDPNYYEYSLCATIAERVSDILDQMAVTLELTSERHDIVKYEQQAKGKGTAAQAYLHVDNTLRMKNILTKLKQQTAVVKKEEDNETLVERMTPLLGIGAEGNLNNSFWTGSLEEGAVLGLDENTSKDFNLLFALGHLKYDDQFKKYKNIYPNHEHGESVAIKKKANDKKKYMSTRFSLSDDGDDAFRWSTAKGKDMYGPERQHAKYLEWTIAKLHKKIPIEMMHRRWPEIVDTWKDDLTSSESYEALAESLLRFEACMRRTLFLSQFWSSLGLTRWTRTTVEDREQSSKETQRRKKDEKDASSPDFDDVDFIRVKYTRLPGKACPQTLWRMKDETYRLGGKMLGGWIWVSSTMERDWQPIPSKPPIGCLSTEPVTGGDVPKEIRKARRLHSIVNKLKSWREYEANVESRNRSHLCYSPSCRRGLTRKNNCEGDIFALSCYSFDCRIWEEALSHNPSCGYESTSASIAKAKDISKFPVKQFVRGEGDKMWPLLLPTNFKSRKTEKKSILNIPDIILKKLARTGGRVQMYIPNFSLSAKSNYSLWNYPCPRPCFDLCWKWLTTNAKSLHAVSLQLKILWYCIKWSEFLPGDDETEDGRLIVHLPDRDEIRHIIAHKEFPPQGTYERYLLQVEGVMLDDDETDDDYEHRGSSSRKKDKITSLRPRRTFSRQARKTARQEWTDGIELKIFEIRSYWESIAPEKTVRSEKVLFTKSFVTAREVYRINNNLPGSSQRPSFSNTNYQKPDQNTPVGNGYGSLQRVKRVIPPRRDSNFAYDDSEFDNMEQAAYNGEPSVKRAKVIIQPGVTISQPNSSYQQTLSYGRGNVGPKSSNGVRKLNGQPNNTSTQSYSARTTLNKNIRRDDTFENLYENKGHLSHNSGSNYFPREASYVKALREECARTGKPFMLRYNFGSAQRLRAVTDDRSESGSSVATPSGQITNRTTTPVGTPGTTIVKTSQGPMVIRRAVNSEQVCQPCLPTRVLIQPRILPAGSVQLRQTVKAPTQQTNGYGQYGNTSNESISGVPIRLQTAVIYNQPRPAQPTADRLGNNVPTEQRIIQVRTSQPNNTVIQSFEPPSTNEVMDFDENFLEPPAAPNSSDNQADITNNTA